MFDIITIGSATRDVFLFTEALHPHKAKDAPAHVEACLPFGAKINIDRIHYDTGGGGTNNAVTFARLGRFKVAALIRIGADSRGRSVLNPLQAAGVDTSFVQITPNEYTAYSAILSPAHNGGERTILVYRGASSHIEHDKIPWRKLQTRWFYISSLGGDLVLFKKILRHAQKIGAQVAWNPGGQELQKIRNSKLEIRNLVAFLILNREEAAKLTGAKFDDTKGLLRALTKFAPSTIMTDGPKGAYAVISRGQGSGIRGQNTSTLKPKTLNLKPSISAYYIPSVGHKPENLTGAGDAFGSGFITGWIKSDGDIKYALRLASFNADSVVQHVGAKNGILEKIPSKNKLQKLPVTDVKLD